MKKVKVKNLKNEEIRLTAFGLDVGPEKVVELDVSEADLKEIENTPFLEIVKGVKNG